MLVRSAENISSGIVTESAATNAHDPTPFSKLSLEVNPVEVLYI